MKFETVQNMIKRYLLEFYLGMSGIEDGQNVIT